MSASDSNYGSGRSPTLYGSKTDSNSDSDSDSYYGLGRSPTLYGSKTGSNSDSDYDSYDGSETGSNSDSDSNNVYYKPFKQTIFDVGSIPLNELYNKDLRLKNCLHTSKLTFDSTFQPDPRYFIFCEVLYPHLEGNNHIIFAFMNTCRRLHSFYSNKIFNFVPVLYAKNALENDCKRCIETISYEYSDWLSSLTVFAYEKGLDSVKYLSKCKLSTVNLTKCVDYCVSSEKATKLIGYLMDKFENDITFPMLNKMVNFMDELTVDHYMRSRRITSKHIDILLPQICNFKLKDISIYFSLFSKEAYNYIIDRKSTHEGLDCIPTHKGLDCIPTHKGLDCIPTDDEEWLKDVIQKLVPCSFTNKNILDDDNIKKFIVDSVIEYNLTLQFKDMFRLCNLTVEQMEKLMLLNETNILLHKHIDSSIDLTKHFNKQVEETCMLYTSQLSCKDLSEYIITLKDKNLVEQCIKSFLGTPYYQYYYGIGNIDNKAKQIIIDYVITNKTPTYMLMNALTLTESQIVMMIPIIYKQRATFGKNDKIIQESKKLSLLCNKEAIIHNYPYLFVDKLNILEKVALLCAFKANHDSARQIIDSMKNNLDELALLGKNVWSPPIYQIKRKVTPDTYYDSSNNDIHVHYQIKIDHKIQNLDYASWLISMNQEHYYDMIHWLITNKGGLWAYGDTVLMLVGNDMFSSVCPFFVVRLLIKKMYNKEIVQAIISKHKFFY